MLEAWECNVCTLGNPEAAKRCYACGIRRRKQKKQKAAKEVALSKLSNDEQGIILGQLRLLCNTLEPRRAVYFSSADSELRALLTEAPDLQLYSWLAADRCTSCPF